MEAVPTVTQLMRMRKDIEEIHIQKAQDTMLAMSGQKEQVEVVMATHNPSMRAVRSTTDKLTINDMSIIEKNHEFADRGTRLIAKIVDRLLLFIPVVVILIFPAAINPVKADENVDALAIVFMFIAAAGIIIFQAYFLAIQGQSIAKKWYKIRIVDVESKKTGGFLQNVLFRTVLNYLFAFLPGYGLIDTLFIFRKDRRCVHDFLAGTVVLNAKENQLATPKKSALWVPSALTAGTALIVLVLYGMSDARTLNPISGVRDDDKNIASVKEFVASEGELTVTTNSNWKEATDLNDDASLQLKLDDDLYAIVISEPSEDFALGLDGYAKLNMNNFINNYSTARWLSGATPTIINGKEAIQYEYDNTDDGINVTFLFTFVESQNYYHQILMWTTKSKYRANKTSFDALLSGFIFDQDGRSDTPNAEKSM